MTWIGLLRQIRKEQKEKLIAILLFGKRNLSAINEACYLKRLKVDNSGIIDI